MKLKCQRCDKEWNYQGFQPYYTNCPSCMVKVKLLWTKEQVEIILKEREKQRGDTQRKEP